MDDHDVSDRPEISFPSDVYRVVNVTVVSDVLDVSDVIVVADVHEVDSNGQSYPDPPWWFPHITHFCLDLLYHKEHLSHPGHVSDEKSTIWRHGGSPGAILSRRIFNGSL